MNINIQLQSHSEQHIQFKNKPQGQNINPDKVNQLMKSLIPLTLPFKNEAGQIIQLWKIPERGMFGSVQDTDGKITVISKDRIHSMISPLYGDSLMERIEQISLRMWMLIYKDFSREIFIMPHMIAAAKGDYNFSRVHAHKKHLFNGELNAAPRELRGEVVKLRDDGKPFNHVHEVRDSQNGLLNIIIRNKEILRRDQNDNHLTPEQREACQKELSEASRLLDQTEKFVPRNPAAKQTSENLQKTNLTDSYNSSNPENPMPERGSTQGEIGGVGCSVEYIQGLFDTPESIFEFVHQFFIPDVNGESLPCSNEELRQLLKELAVGIYVHETVPFFSLHFNQDTHLYPIIHPAYQNTLVGQVISMLDYIMKGYLNGAVFKEEFIRVWQQNPQPINITESSDDLMINFYDYANTHLNGNDKIYHSARVLLKLYENGLLDKIGRGANKVLKAVGSNKQVGNYNFADYTKFSNSFRIISKQNKIEKSDGLFVLNSDFDVFYTIEPDPDYQVHLDAYIEVNGSYPPAYQHLINVYDTMKVQIHDHLTKMPFCKKYFSMLGIINFFSHYFMTLKKHRKFPILPDVSLTPASAPTLFPALPIFTPRDFTLVYHTMSVMLELIKQRKDTVQSYFDANNQQDKLQYKNVLKQVWLELVWKDNYDHAESLDKFYFLKEKQDFIQMIDMKIPFDTLEIIDGFFNVAKQNSSKPIEMNSFLSLMARRSTDNEVINEMRTIDNQMACRLKSRRLMVVLPGDQSFDDQEFGKKIVGGCGIKMAKLHVQASPDAPTIMANVKETLGNTPNGEWIPYHAEEGDQLKGSLFKLAFEDLPLGIIDFKEDLHALLVEQNLVTGDEPSSSTDIPQPITPIVKLHRILACVIKGEQDKFLAEIGSYPVQNLVDYQGRNLLHRLAHVDLLFFIEELLRAGVSPQHADEQGYLPIHYAAMCGNVDVLNRLYEADKNTINARSLQGASPLLVAIQHDQIKAVAYILQKMNSIASRTKDGYTVLHTAVHHGNEQIVKLLLEMSKDGKSLINKKTNEKITPLLLACESGNLSLVNMLLEHGADPRIASSNGNTPLDIAVIRNDLPLTQLLLGISTIREKTIEKAITEGSLEINQLISSIPGYHAFKNWIGDNALLMSLRQGNIEVFKHLLSTLTDPSLLNVKNKVKETPVLLAAMGGFYEIVMELLNKGAIVDPELLVASLLRTHYQGQNDELNQWIKAKAFTEDQLRSLVLVSLQVGNHLGVSELFDPDNELLNSIQGPGGWTVEHYLAKSNGLFLFKMRMMHHHDYMLRLNIEKGKSLAYLAAENRSWSVFSYLLMKLKEQNIPLENHYDGRHLFYAVYESGDINGIKSILESSDDPRLVDLALDSQNTCGIHLAVKNGSKDILEYLLYKGTRLNQMDNQGYDPLCYAIKYNNDVAIEFLLEHSVPVSVQALYLASREESVLNKLLMKGANLNRPCPMGDTPILIAAKEKNFVAFCTLLNKGAQLSVKNQKGWSPLLYAAHNGNLPMLQIILNSVMNPEQDTIQGCTALHLATRQSHVTCMRALIDRGFSINATDGKGVTVRADAQKFFAGRALIGVQADEQTYERMLFDLRLAISENNLDEIYNDIARWKVNTYFPININGTRYEGTLLHILCSYCGSSEKLNGLISLITNQPGFNGKLLDSNGNSYAHLLVKVGYNLTLVNNLQLDVKNNDNKTPLHVAAKNKQFYFFGNLIDALVAGVEGIDAIPGEEDKRLFVQSRGLLDLEDQLGLTPLLDAIKNEHKDFVECLISKGANVHHISHNGMNPLIFACTLNNYSIVRRLLQAGADINLLAGPNNQVTPLAGALGMGNEKMARFLLFRGAKVTSLDSATIPHLAAKEGNASILRFLAEKGVSMQSADAGGLRPIHHSAAAKTLKPLEELQKMGISIHAKNDGISPLYYAASRGKVEAVKWLLDNRVDPLQAPSIGNESLNILQAAMFNSSVNAIKIIELFKSYLLSTDLNHLLPAIQVAIQRDYVEPLKVLYDLGVNPDSKLNEHNYTGLHLACKFGALQCTEFFLTKAVDYTCQTSSGETPLEFAASNKCASQFRMMLHHLNPDLDEQNIKGQTLLHISVQSGNKAHAALLLGYGAAINVQDVQGHTPLFFAAEKKDVELVTLLMICGADSELQTFYSERKPSEIGDDEIRNQIIKIKQLRNQPNMTPLLIAKMLSNSLAEKICMEIVNYQEDKN